MKEFYGPAFNFQAEGAHGNFHVLTMYPELKVYTYKVVQEKEKNCANLSEYQDLRFFEMELQSEGYLFRFDD